MIDDLRCQHCGHPVDAADVARAFSGETAGYADRWFTCDRCRGHIRIERVTIESFQVKGYVGRSAHEQPVS